jgi:hypothetical protein
MDYLTKEYLLNWTKTHCRTKEEIDMEREKARNEAEKAISSLDTAIITHDPITFKASDFKSVTAFGMALELASKRFNDYEQITVRYAKPFKDKRKVDVDVIFEIFDNTPIEEEEEK